MDVCVVCLCGVVCVLCVCGVWCACCMCFLYDMYVVLLCVCVLCVVCVYGVRCVCCVSVWCVVWYVWCVSVWYVVCLCVWYVCVPVNNCFREDLSSLCLYNDCHFHTKHKQMG